MLAEIEKTAGVQLFDRLPRGIAPTDYGEILIRRSRSMLADLRHAASELEGRKAGNSGAVSIGFGGRAKRRSVGSSYSGTRRQARHD
jgi:DNA-binding transcriptional LysR family regulator